MRKERKSIPVSSIDTNNGQLSWLPKNPREWTQTDIDRTAKSIQEDTDFLEDRPLLLLRDGDRYIVFAGNLRREGARKSGIKSVPSVIYYPETEDDQLTIKRRAMKDNGSFGSWDFDALANEWDDLPLTDWGIPAWESEETPIIPSVQEDDFDENAEGVLVRCNPGDIWQLGDHRLMCGDSTDLETVKKLMGGGLADMIFTDPPYGVSYTDKNEFLNRIGKPIGVPNPIENDSKSPEEMNIFWKQVFGNLAEITKDDAAYYVTSPAGGDLLLLLLAIRETPFALKHTLIWNKNNHILGRCDYNYKHEPIIYGWKKKGTHHFYGAGKFKTSVWDIDKPLKNDLHPTMKPVELVANCLLDCTKEGDSVVDVFGGSGTTLIAAEQLKRRCYMMELDPHYCDVIIARWETLTGKTAQLITPGEKGPQT